MESEKKTDRSDNQMKFAVTIKWLSVYSLTEEKGRQGRDGNCSRDGREGMVIAVGMVGKVWQVGMGS